MSALLHQLLQASHGASAGGGGFTPADLPGLQAWWDFSDTDSLTIDAGAISQANDKSGNGRHLQQSSSSSRFTPGTYGGLAAAVGALDQYMTIASALSLTTGSFWAFAVARAASNAILLDGIGVGVNPYLISPRASAIVCSLPDGDLTTSASGTFDASADLYATVATGSGLTQSINATSGSGAMKTGFQIFYVGGRSSFRGFDRLCEICVGSSALSAGEIADVKAYLSSKWGTP